MKNPLLEKSYRIQKETADKKVSGEKPSVSGEKRFWKCFLYEEASF